MEKQTEELLLEVLTAFYTKMDAERRMQRRAGIVAYSFLGIALLATMAYFAFMNAVNTRGKDNETAWADSPANWDWSDMWDDVEQGDFDAAVEKSTCLLSRNPENPFNNSTVGDMYVSFCAYEEAKQHYQKAYDLWPSEAHECDLDTVNKKLGLNQ